MNPSGKPLSKSPLDVAAIRTGVTSADIVAAVREGRRRPTMKGRPRSRQ